MTLLQEVISIIRDKSFTHSLLRIQDGDFIMCGFYCIAFIECMLAGKTFLDYTNFFLRITIKRMTSILNL